ncbi:MAG: S-methyl-5-thioribose-1-phosphate isomerase [Bdellovibrionaceae bacterium]|nr:S-methyl-5-thioribose-1-phosphate isomerase [Pseudobdellovibrionaceae bacterium]
MNTINLKSLALTFSYNAESVKLRLLDQTLLPHEEKWLDIRTTDQMIDAIKKLQVRGAPLIGVAASLQLAQAAFLDFNIDTLGQQADALYAARPTAVNLMNCINRMKKNLITEKNKASFIQAAIDLFNEDVELCERISCHGASLINDGDNILTHCNTGGLATAGVGTALGIIRKAFENGKKIHVYVDETRPLLQGGRLTAWELQKLNIPCTLITDNMAAQLMSLGKIDKVFVGSDRIAANGDFANKIGTYGVAVNCHYHKIPFYVAAPFTTVDSACAHGKNIPIEQRAAFEVRGAQGSFGHVTWAPENVNVYNPSFDVTPAVLTSGWVMDKGIFKQDDILKGCFS